jgi:hypothetical protein
VSDKQIQKIQSKQQTKVWYHFGAIHQIISEAQYLYLCGGDRLCGRVYDDCQCLFHADAFAAQRGTAQRTESAVGGFT